MLCRYCSAPIRSRIAKFCVGCGVELDHAHSLSYLYGYLGVVLLAVGYFFYPYLERFRPTISFPQLQALASPSATPEMVMDATPTPLSVPINQGTSLVIPNASSDFAGLWGAHHFAENAYDSNGNLLKRIIHGPMATGFVLEKGALTVVYHDIYEKSADTPTNETYKAWAPNPNEVVVREEYDQGSLHNSLTRYYRLVRKGVVAYSDEMKWYDVPSHSLIQINRDRALLSQFSGTSALALRQEMADWMARDGLTQGALNQIRTLHTP